MRLVTVLLLFGCATAAHGQRVTSYSADAGVAMQKAAEPTAAFALSAGFCWGVPWLAWLQRSVADLKPEPGGTLRATSLTVGPAVEVGPRIMLAAGAALFALNQEWSDSTRERRTKVVPATMLAFNLPLAGEGVRFEIVLRADHALGDFAARYSALAGVRVKPDAPKLLARGEPLPPRLSAERAAVWNDVMMQLILLEQSLESFDRIKEIESGIELEFDLRSVTLYDDVAKAARVLAAAEPPVYITVFAPNAGRVAAAATAGSFPPERLRLQRENRVYLRVEH